MNNTQSGRVPPASQDAQLPDMKVQRRTFEAAKHPKGSAERARLNLATVTSEYMTSYRYCVDDSPPNSPRTFRTKSEAVAYALAVPERSEVQK